MLGRLRMTVDQCIEAFTGLATEVFTLEKINENSKKPIFSAPKLEAFCKKLIKQYLKDDPDGVDALMCPKDEFNAKQDLHDNTPRGRV